MQIVKQMRVERQHASFTYADVCRFLRDEAAKHCKDWHAAEVELVNSDATADEEMFVVKMERVAP